MRADGDREALRLLMIDRDNAVQSCKTARTALAAILVTAPAPLREQLRPLARERRAKECAALTIPKGADRQTRVLHQTLIRLGQRIAALAAAVADLGEQGSGAHSPGTGQAGEDVAVGVSGEEPADLFVQDTDLLVQRGGHACECQGDLAAGLGLGAGQSRRRSHQPGVQHGGRDAAGIPGGAQPRGEAGRGQPPGPGCGREPAQERQADRAGGLGEQADRAGKRQLQVRAAARAPGPGSPPGPCGTGTTPAAPGSPRYRAAAASTGARRSAACPPAHRHRTGRPYFPPTHTGCAGP